MTAPKIDTFLDLADKANQDAVVSFVKSHPLEDHVYYFPNKETPNSSKIITSRLADINTNSVYAGSSALHLLMTKLMGGYAHTIRWKPTDVDVFYIGRDKNDRAPLGILDVVQTTDKNVEELLLNFDLPCCRAAYNDRYDIWISAQCIASIFTRHYYLPEYMRDKRRFIAMVSCYRNPVVKDPIPEIVELLESKTIASEEAIIRLRDIVDKSKNHSIDRIDGVIAMLFNRLQDRIKKYSDRGFGAIYFETEEPSPFIKNRFHYAE